jgi:hypothetical protein
MVAPAYFIAGRAIYLYRRPGGIRLRTTLDIEEDVLAAVKELAGREKTSVGKVISRILREQLKLSRQILYRNGIPTLPSRGVVVTNEMIEKIREEEGI